MATPKKKPETTGQVFVRAKSPRDWSGLLQAVKAAHWRKLAVTIQIRSRLMAGKPAALDAAQAMLAARGLTEYMEAVADIEDPAERAQAAERVAKDEGLCEFSRRPERHGVWIPSNNIKAGLKENWSVLGYRKEVPGSTKAMAEGLFVFGADAQTTEDRDWVRVGDAPDGVYQAVCHTMGPRGPVTSIKRHEYVERAVLNFEIWISQRDSVMPKISDEFLASTMEHFSEHGLGACRSQGFGKFDLVEIHELD